MGPRRIVLDCGLRDLASLEAARDRLETADLLFCSHAHSDHARGVWDFSQRFPQVPIYGSEVTAQLLPLNWLGEEVPPHLCQALPWQTPISLADDLTVQIWPAGHLPGAVCALFTYHSPQRLYTVFFTGDFFMSNSRLVDGLPLEALRGLKPDVLIIEGSAGTARHPHRRQQENLLASTLHRLVQQGRSVLLPTPTLGIGQELVMLLRSHYQFTGQDITVWVDETVAAGCDLYLDLMSEFPSSVQNFARHQPLFWDDRILPRVRRLGVDGHPDGSRPCILIAHREADLSDHCRTSAQPWTVLLPDSFAGNLADTVLGTPSTDAGPTLGWLQTLAPELEAERVQLDTYQLTTHSDRVGTTQLIHNLRPQHVAFVHGKPAHLADLAGLEELQTRYQLHLPSTGHEVEFPIGDRFIQPAAPDPVFEGEITQVDDSVLLLLPEDLTTDPRWTALSDTGLVQARWQGSDLVIKGLSQRDLLRTVTGGETPWQSPSCQTCRHLRESRCRNPDSPLYGLQVSPEGVCPAFEARPAARQAQDDEASA
ncbi:MBL fold metallo-hydrolase [Nodosilinea nodulosa]|uniref:MBL fold metallo-hydrolase n=1 Tax=Nodosilinea nodulosa TaxID=416001 RepID=UPI000368E572|nr:MBL fold metallo-hydrolase [Nodosilinea nodulosa]